MAADLGGSARCRCRRPRRLPICRSGRARGWCSMRRRCAARVRRCVPPRPGRIEGRFARAPARPPRDARPAQGCTMPKQQGRWLPQAVPAGSGTIPASVFARYAGAPGLVTIPAFANRQENHSCSNTPSPPRSPSASSGQRTPARRSMPSNNADSWSVGSTPTCRVSRPPTARATGPASTSTSARRSPPAFSATPARSSGCRSTRSSASRRCSPARSTSCRATPPGR